MNAAAFLLLSLLAAPALAEALPPLRMTGPDSARAVYPEKCANGGNLDGENRELFFQKMLADPRSRLAKTKVELLKKIAREGEEPRGDGVYFGDWNETYNDRSGCGTAVTSFSRLIQTMVGGNTDHLVTRSLLTIDDEDDGGVRTLKLRSIQPLAIRD